MAFCRKWTSKSANASPTGTILAKVADPKKLKAALQIAETQMKDVRIGLDATVDTRNGIIPGRVIRIDPAATNGTVGVDVALLGPLPQGARPELSVDGTVEIERLSDVVYVDRPVSGEPGTTIGLFKIDPRRQRRQPRECQAGPRLGQHHRGARRFEGGRSGDSVRYVAVRFVSTN